MSPRGRGRPPKLDDQLINQVADIVRAGNYIETACASVGIERQTMYAWMREGAAIRRELDKHEADESWDAAYDQLAPLDQLKVDFSYALQKANAEAETIAVLRISKAGSEGAWQADMTRLERRHPKRWGRREAVEVSGQLDGVQVQADSPAAAVTASKALKDARARELAADLLVTMANTDEPIEGDESNEAPPPSSTDAGSASD